MAVLTNTELTGCDSIPAFLAAGTVAVFRQSAAPSSWTKDTTNNNNRALRCVTGTASSGGNVAFTTAFASKPVTGNIASNATTNVSVTVGNHTLSTGQLASHSHPNGTGPFNANVQGFVPNTPQVSVATPGNTGNAGSGSSHNHPGSGSGTTTVTSTLTGDAINLQVQYVDVVQCTKDATDTTLND